MPTIQNTPSLGGAGLLLLLVVGCDAGTGSLASVRGTVFYKRTPLKTGTIVFIPDVQRGADGPLARAAIQPDGTYILRTGDLLGAARGWYRVTVVALEADTEGRQSKPFVIPRSLLPEKYRDPELSGLTCEIKAERENRIDFHLE
jgi:hypothetical protein